MLTRSMYTKHGSDRSKYRFDVQIWTLIVWSVLTDWPICKCLEYLHPSSVQTDPNNSHSSKLIPFFPNPSWSCSYRDNLSIPNDPIYRLLNSRRAMGLKIFEPARGGLQANSLGLQWRQFYASFVISILQFIQISPNYRTTISLKTRLMENIVSFCRKLSSIILANHTK